MRSSPVRSGWEPVSERLSDSERPGSNRTSWRSAAAIWSAELDSGMPPDMAYIPLCQPNSARVAITLRVAARQLHSRESSWLLALVSVVGFSD